MSLVMATAETAERPPPPPKRLARLRRTAIRAATRPATDRGTEAGPPDRKTVRFRTAENKDNEGTAGHPSPEHPFRSFLEELIQNLSFLAKRHAWEETHGAEEPKGGSRPVPSGSSVED